MSQRSEVFRYNQSLILILLQKLNVSREVISGGGSSATAVAFLFVYCYSRIQIEIARCLICDVRAASGFTAALDSHLKEDEI